MPFGQINKTWNDYIEIIAYFGLVEAKYHQGYFDAHTADCKTE